MLILLSVLCIFCYGFEFGIAELDAIESGEQKADRLFFLEQEAFNRRRESLQLAQLIPQSAPQPAPQPLAQAQSSGKPDRNLYEEQGMPF